ncbi:DUF4238 domain-containing protein [Treponema vincentii]|uniref:DUF4238 domain-containing protein n=1 Tax=Treponema vincentii TaxID=69710 RepID=UPI003D92DB5C
MNNTVKQSHLVPQCYLKNFSVNNKVSAFNKRNNCILTNQNISEVATQNKFYDLSEDDLNELRSIIPDITKQYIENYLSKTVEPKLAEFINKISMIDLKGLVNKYNVCFSNNDKYNFNLFLVYQLFRTRKCRELLAQIIGKMQAAKMQKKLLIDVSLFENIAKELMEYQWLIYVNTTDIEYITSDNPVIIYDATLEGQIRLPVSFSGGLQILYPLTKRLLLSISDIKIMNIDVNNIFDCTEENDPYVVSFINRMHYYNSFMFQYSSNQNPSIESFLPKDNFELKKENYDDIKNINSLSIELFNMLKDDKIDKERVGEIEKQIRNITAKYI